MDATNTAELTVNTLEHLNLHDIIYIIVAFAIIFAAASSIAFIFLGGFSFILSGGDDTKVKNAIHTVRHAIFGLLFCMASIVIVPLIGRIFGLNLDLLDRQALIEKYNLLYSILVKNPYQTTEETTPATSATNNETVNPDVSLEELIQ